MARQLTKLACLHYAHLTLTTLENYLLGLILSYTCRLGSMCCFWIVS